MMGAKDLVEKAGGRAPILNSKSSDDIPMSIVHGSSVKAGAKKVRRTGKAGVELLVKNQFLRALLPCGEWATRVLLQEPVSMTEGKSAAAISAVSFQDWLSLRQLGHLGCSLEHYAWDRAGLTALERLSRQWHKQQELPVLPDDLAPEVLRLTEFVVVTPLRPPRRPERVQVGLA